jgi:Fur family ferric uptake transcriptional regulator
MQPSGVTALLPQTMSNRSLPRTAPKPAKPEAQVLTRAPRRAVAAKAASLRGDDAIDALLSAHGLRRTHAARRVLGWLLANADTSYTHAQLQAALEADAPRNEPLDRVTLYRLIDRLTQVSLLLCRVDSQRVRRYQAMPTSVHGMPHFECQSCHRDSPLAGALKTRADDLERAAENALQALRALGYQDMQMDFAVRGVCADCASEQGRA